MDLAVLCVMWRRKYHQPMPFGCFQFTRIVNPPLSGTLPPPTLHPYRSAYGIDIASKNYLKWWVI